MISLGLVAMVLALLRLSLLPLYSQAKPHARPPLDQILSGSFASGATESCKDSELVLVSWNIARGVRMSEILQAFRGILAADVYILQEVDLHTRRTGYRNVAEEIARELNLNYVFGVEFEELAQGRPGQAAFHGQAVLSRFPISRARVLRFRHQLHNWGRWWLPRWSWLQPRRGGRMALVVEIQRGGRTWAIYDTHLESKADDAGRAQQMREILEDIQAHYPTDTSVIVAGDLNTRQGAESAVVQELENQGFEDVLQNYKGSLRTKVRSNRRADWILMRHLRFADVDMPRVDISDHYPLIVHIPVPRAAASR